MQKKLNQKGFTIIEVLIVLAIAALILLVVFLAVPALRRNAANSGRANDASRISSAVNECLSNRNGSTSACSTIGSGAVDVGTLAQLDTTKVTFPTSITIPTGSTSYVLAADADASSAEVIFKAKCSDDGVGAQTSSNSRDVVVLYWKKGSGSTNTSLCIGS